MTHTLDDLRELWPTWTEVDPETGCWNWKRARHSTWRGKYRDYGLIASVALAGRRNRPMTAHRAAYLLFVGPVPEGFHLHHVCRNGTCTNPDHLVVLTPKDHGDAHRRERCGRGHNDWYVSRTGKRQCRTCHRENAKISYHKNGKLA